MMYSAAAASTTPHQGPPPRPVAPSARPPRPGLSPVQRKQAAQQLVAYHALYKGLFARREQRLWSLLYLRGQLGDLERKSIEPMVLALRGPDPAAVRALQTFLGEGAWDDRAILRRHQELVAKTLAEPQGVLIVDGSGFAKQGNHSVGVARQYCGHVGKVANCQQGVFAAYSSSKGCTFVDCRLYRPQRWFQQEYAPLRQRCRVPSSLRFCTEPHLALERVRTLNKRGQLPFEWVLGDETYGADPKFLDGVEALGKCYFVEVPKTTRVYVGTVPVQPPGLGERGRPRKHPRVEPGTPAAQEVHKVAAQLPASAWQSQILKEGTKGPIAARVACVRVTRSQSRGRPGAAAWLVLRRGLAADSELKMFLSNAPQTMNGQQLGHLSSLRWPIETLIEEARSELGMDHYEVRSWRGWHHQMTQTFLAHHFLLQLRRSQEKKALR
jgi:SRSO17 transposase